MIRVLARLFILCAALFGGSTALAAQAPAPDTDIRDLVREWLNKGPAPQTSEAGKKMIVFAPIIGSNPSAGFLVGAAAQVAFFQGDPKTTRITSGIASFTISSKKQVMLNLRFDSFSDGNTWQIKSDNRFQNASQSIYGFGTSTPDSAAIPTDYGFVRLHETLLRRAAGDLYLGGGFLFDSHANIKPADAANPSWPAGPFIAYSQQHGLPTDSQQSAGVSVNLLLNKRDHDINAYRGWTLGGDYRWSFEGFLGGDSSWQQAELDARAYVPLDGRARNRLAFWSYTSLVTSGIAPYFDLPTTVMDQYGRSARGYQEGRYRGERLVYGEVEYRGTITSNGLLGFVSFVTATTVSNRQTGEKLFDSIAPSAGAGLRLLVDKRSRTNLCFDVAWGKDTASGVYLALQEAF
jgi:outer membrane protein assembly factor BamA